MSGGGAEATAVAIGWVIRLVSHSIDFIMFPWNVVLALGIVVAIGLDIYVWVKRRNRRVAQREADKNV